MVRVTGYGYLDKSSIPVRFSFNMSVHCSISYYRCDNVFIATRKLKNTVPFPLIKNNNTIKITENSC